MKPRRSVIIDFIGHWQSEPTDHIVNSLLENTAVHDAVWIVTTEFSHLQLPAGLVGQFAQVGTLSPSQGSASQSEQGSVLPGLLLGILEQELSECNGIHWANMFYDFNFQLSSINQFLFVQR